MANSIKDAEYSATPFQAALGEGFCPECLVALDGPHGNHCPQCRAWWFGSGQYGPTSDRNIRAAARVSDPSAAVSRTAGRM